MILILGGTTEGRMAVKVADDRSINLTGHACAFDRLGEGLQIRQFDVRSSDKIEAVFPNAEVS